MDELEGVFGFLTAENAEKYTQRTAEKKYISQTCLPAAKIAKSTFLVAAKKEIRGFTQRGVWDGK